MHNLEHDNWEFLQSHMCQVLENSVNATPPRKGNKEANMSKGSLLVEMAKSLSFLTQITIYLTLFAFDGWPQKEHF